MTTVPEIRPANPTRPARKPFLYRRSGMWTVRIVFAALLFGSWQIYAHDLPAALIAPPTDVANAFYRQFISEQIIYARLQSSLTALLLGFLIGSAIGLPVGVAMGRSRRVEHTLDSYVAFLYALPHVVFIPIMVIWLGFDLQFRVAYVAFAAVFPVIMNTMSGVKNIDPELLSVGASFCAKSHQMLRTIVLPAASPYMATGLRQGFSAAWIGTVVAEILTTGSGIGGLITDYANSFLTADMFVPIMCIMVIAVLIQALSEVLQRKLMPWNTSSRSH